MGYLSLVSAVCFVTSLRRSDHLLGGVNTECCVFEFDLETLTLRRSVAYPGNFFQGVYARIFFSGVQQIQLRTEGGKNGDLGAVFPAAWVPLNLQMNETRILIRLLRMYISRNWEFGSALSKRRNFGGVVEPLQPPPPRYATGGDLGPLGLLSHEGVYRDALP
jgi:hypothetical protein